MPFTREKLRRCLNGYNGKVSFKGLPVYHNWMRGDDYNILGIQLNKANWIYKNIKKPEHYHEVWLMLVDWILYEKGWFVASYDNSQLHHYICQITYTRPDALFYIKK